MERRAICLKLAIDTVASGDLQYGVDFRIAAVLTAAKRYEVYIMGADPVS